MCLHNVHYTNEGCSAKGAHNSLFDLKIQISRLWYTDPGDSSELKFCAFLVVEGLDLVKQQMISFETKTKEINHAIHQIGLRK